MTKYFLLQSGELAAVDENGIEIIRPLEQKGNGNIEPKLKTETVRAIKASKESLIPRRGRKKRVEITDEIKDEIQELKKSGMTSGKVAEKLGISLPSVNRYWVK